MTAPKITTSDKHSYVRLVALSWPKGEGPAVTLQGGTAAAPRPLAAVLANVDLRYTWYPEIGYWSGDATVMVHKRLGTLRDREWISSLYRHPELKEVLDRFLAEHHPGTTLLVSEERVPA